MSSLSLNNKLINSVSKFIIYENNVKVIENNLIDFISMLENLRFNN